MFREINLYKWQFKGKVKTWISCCNQSQEPAHNFDFLFHFKIASTCMCNFIEKTNTINWSNHLVKVSHKQSDKLHYNC